MVGILRFGWIEHKLDGKYIISDALSRVLEKITVSLTGVQEAGIHCVFIVGNEGLPIKI
jgi:hypothetical protein